MTMKNKTAVAIIAVCLLTAAVLRTELLPGNGVAAAKEKSMTVRVLIYSGNPDPTYELSDPQIVAKLKSAFEGSKRLDNFSRESVIPAQIGYKGMLVENPDRIEGIPDRFAVYHGTIEVMGVQKQFLEDKDEAVEKLLMNEAVSKGAIKDVILKRMNRER
ncbi:MAG TPA: hypothetical protein VK452_01510 [Dissulfurispiraceae bacterium]|nr:hypothetical protein [Dissulfurispiraceae bacterium]